MATAVFRSDLGIQPAEPLGRGTAVLTRDVHHDPAIRQHFNIVTRRYRIGELFGQLKSVPFIFVQIGTDNPFGPRRTQVRILAAIVYVISLVSIIHSHKNDVEKPVAIDRRVIAIRRQPATVAQYDPRPQPHAVKHGIYEHSDVHPVPISSLYSCIGGRNAA